jgi:hypothetical protein
MAELMETLEAIQETESNLRAALSSGGAGDVRILGAPETRDAWGVDDAWLREDGMKRVRTRETDPGYMNRLAFAARLLAEVKTGKRPVYHLQEAMSTSDFPSLFGDIIDRQLLQWYAETPVTYPNYIKVNDNIPDFRTVKRFPIDGGAAVLLSVAQGEEYPESSMTDGIYSYAVTKYGRVLPFTWETIINDDLGAFTNIPERFGRACRRSEEKFATQLFAASTGPNATFFTSGHKNLDATPAALSIATLQKLFTLLFAQTDTDGEPIAIDGVILVVPPQLEIIAQNIINATQLWVGGDGQADGGGNLGQRLITANWMQRRVKLVTNYYLPIVDTTKGTTAYYLFADPQTSRPAAEFGKLRGHTTPEMFMKSPNAVRIGGGIASPMDGDFDTDSIRYKVRDVFGGVLMDFRMAAANAGA